MNTQHITRLLSACRWDAYSAGLRILKIIMELEKEKEQTIIDAWELNRLSAIATQLHELSVELSAFGGEQCGPTKQNSQTPVPARNTTQRT